MVGFHDMAGYGCHWPSIDTQIYPAMMWSIPSNDGAPF